jgi:hypothetical protein
MHESIDCQLHVITGSTLEQYVTERGRSKKQLRIAPQNPKTPDNNIENEYQSFVWLDYTWNSSAFIKV